MTAQHAKLQLLQKDAVLSDYDSDRSDMDYEGETGHLPARLLNAYVELMQTNHDRSIVISDDTCYMLQESNNVEIH